MISGDVQTDPTLAFMNFSADKFSKSSKFYFFSFVVSGFFTGWKVRNASFAFPRLLRNCFLLYYAISAFYFYLLSVISQPFNRCNMPTLASKTQSASKAGKYIEEKNQKLTIWSRLSREKLLHLAQPGVSKFWRQDEVPPLRSCEMCRHSQEGSLSYHFWKLRGSVEERHTWDQMSQEHKHWNSHLFVIFISRLKPRAGLSECAICCELHIFMV